MDGSVESQFSQRKREVEHPARIPRILPLHSRI
jgi:hypothetical protein